MDIHYREPEVLDTARTLIEAITPQTSAATVLGLTGDLGAGKTTLVKAIAGLLGVIEPVVSPTFVIAKYYETTDPRWQQLVHIDAYRIQEVTELEALSWQTLLAQPKTLVIVEWPENIRGALPSSMHEFTLAHHDNARHITLL